MKTGQVLISTDLNSQTTTNYYDVLGRLTKVVGPNDTESLPAVSYTYDLNTVPTKVSAASKINGAGSTITTHSFYDGMGRCIQTKSPDEDPNRQVVNGTVKFNSRGLIEEKYTSYFVANDLEYSDPNYTHPKVTYQYDSMGRVMQVTSSDGTFSLSANSGDIFSVK